MAAAAVVVALCLLFSWVYLDDGDGRTEFRTAQVGDVMVWNYHIVDEKGEWNSTRSARRPSWP